jgi:hypothetical protein
MYNDGPERMIVGFEFVGVDFYRAIQTLVSGTQTGGVDPNTSRQIFEESIRQMFDHIDPDVQIYMTNATQLINYSLFIIGSEFFHNPMLREQFRQIFVTAALGLYFCLNDLRCFSYGKDLIIDHAEPTYLVIQLA